MPHHDNAPPGDRIFGRIDRFDCECPSCGALIRGQLTPRAQGGAVADQLDALKKGGRLARGRRSNQATAYNPLTSTLTCPFCYRKYQVGLILWPAKPDKRYAIPEDQKVNRRHALQLRALAQGIVAEQLKAKHEPTNVYVRAECTCPIRGWKPTCPVHGLKGERTRQDDAGEEKGGGDATTPDDRDE